MLGARLDGPMNKGNVQQCISPAEEQDVKFLPMIQPGLGASSTHPPRAHVCSGRDYLCFRGLGVIAAKKWESRVNGSVCNPGAVCVLVMSKGQ